MSNDANRMLVVLTAAAMIVIMAIVIFLTWTADTDVIDKVGDLAEYLDAHNDNAGKVIVTLSALIVVVLSLLMIILELAPEDEEKELRVKQAGATTIVPAAALKGRIEEALVALPEVTAAKARVNARDKGIATALDLTIVPGANIAMVTQESARVVTDTIQTDLGLPVAGVPTVRVAYGGAKTRAASSVSQAPSETPVSASPMEEPPAEAAVAEPQPQTPSWTQEQAANPEAEPHASTAPEQPSEPADSAQPDSEVSRDPWRST